MKVTIPLVTYLWNNALASGLEIARLARAEVVKSEQTDSGAVLIEVRSENYEALENRLIEFGTAYKCIPVIFVSASAPITETPKPVEPVPLFRIKVLANVLNVRAMPISGTIVRTLAKDEIVGVLEVSSTGWYRIGAGEWITPSQSYVQKLS